MTEKPTFHKVLMGDVARIQSGYSFSSSDWQESGIGVVKIAWSRKTIGTMDQLIAALSSGLMDGNLDISSAMQIVGSE